MMRYERTSLIRHPGRVAVVVVLLVAVVGVLLLHRGVFVLRNVWVEGQTRYTEQQVVEMSGLRHGQSIFSLDQQGIAGNLRQATFLVLDSIYIDYPDTLILRVRERGPRVAVSALGRLIMLDEQNCVMEVSGQLDARLQIPVITGLEPYDVVVGSAIVTPIPAQLTAMNAVLRELELQMVTARVSELNVTNLDNLYLVTKEGLKVELGDCEQMETKIGMMRGVLERLAEMGMYAGTLDVSTPYKADYLEGQSAEYQPKVEPTAVPNELVGR